MDQMAFLHLHYDRYRNRYRWNGPDLRRGPVTAWGRLRTIVLFLPRASDDAL